MKHTHTARSLLLAGLLAGACAVPALAQVSLNIGIGPPAPIYEPVPVLQPGYIWAPGYWTWHDGRHIWIHGRAVYGRAGYRWAPDHWDHRGDRYYRVPGRWER